MHGCRWKQVSGGLRIIPINIELSINKKGCVGVNIYSYIYCSILGTVGYTATVQGYTSRPHTEKEPCKTNGRAYRDQNSLMGFLQGPAQCNHNTTSSQFFVTRLQGYFTRFHQNKCSIVQESPLHLFLWGIHQFVTCFLGAKFFASDYNYHHNNTSRLSRHARTEHKGISHSHLELTSRTQ